MKSLFTIVAAGLLASSFAVSADAAAKKKDPAMAQHQAKCQTQARRNTGHPLPEEACVREKLHESKGVTDCSHHSSRPHDRRQRGRAFAPAVRRAKDFKLVPQEMPQSNAVQDVRGA